MSTHETINHPTIGLVRGIQRLSKVSQFLGIQYATLRDRFSRGELLQEYPSSADALDATKLGYDISCLQCSQPNKAKKEVNNDAAPCP